LDEDGLVDLHYDRGIGIREILSLKTGNFAFVEATGGEIRSRRECSLTKVKGLRRGQFPYGPFCRRSCCAATRQRARRRGNWRPVPRFPLLDIDVESYLAGTWSRRLHRSRCSIVLAPQPIWFMGSSVSPARSRLLATCSRLQSVRWKHAPQI